MPSIRTFTVRNPVAHAWKAPELEEPVLISEGSLTPLGEHKGRKWYSHQLGELAEGQVIRPSFKSEWDFGLQHAVPVEHTPLGNRPILQTQDENGDTLYVPYTIHEPGTFARFSTAVARAAARVKPLAPVDALSAVRLLGHATEYGGFAKIRGAAAILEQLRARGAILMASVDGTEIVVLTPGGKPVPAGILEAVTAARNLLLPYLTTGKEPPCVVTKHAKPTPAVTVTGTGAPWCATCEPKP